MWVRDFPGAYTGLAVFLHLLDTAFDAEIAHLALEIYLTFVTPGNIH